MLDLSEREIEVLRAHVQRLAREAKEEGDLQKSHSIEETEKALSRIHSSPSRRKRRSRSA